MSNGYLTLSERKSTEVARLHGSVDRAKKALAEYARAHNGRFILFGSAARGDMRFDSDFDLAVDFPLGDAFNEAWDFAEKVCVSQGLRPDLSVFGALAPEFVTHIKPTWVELS